MYSKKRQLSIEPVFMRGLRHNSLRWPKDSAAVSKYRIWAWMMKIISEMPNRLFPFLRSEWGRAARSKFLPLARTNRRRLILWSHWLTAALVNNRSGVAMPGSGRTRLPGCTAVTSGLTAWERQGLVTNLLRTGRARKNECSYDKAPSVTEQHLQWKAFCYPHILPPIGVSANWWNSRCAVHSVWLWSAPFLLP